MKRQLLKIAVTAVLAGMAGYSADVLAAKGSPGPPPGKGGGGGETTAGNNLSYPAVLFTGSSVTPFFDVKEGTFGVTYSYGCGIPETVGKFEYPNTSCVSGWNADGTAVSFLTAAQCTGADTSWAGAKPCEGSTVDRIYWQKETLNKWSAEATVLNVQPDSPAIARFVDWGDSIESVTWSSTSILRVETQLYLDLSKDERAEIPPDEGATSGTQRGFQMWHSQGQGTTEQWGVRVSEKVPPGATNPVMDSWYGYLGPYAIVNAGTATLLLTKLQPGTAACPTTPYAGPPFTSVGWTGSGWDTGCTLAPVPYTVELSVTGKYVHGYNWRMSNLSDPLPTTYCGEPDWKKAGWWRLTFLPNSDGGTKVAFPSDADGVALTAPPAPEYLPQPVVLAAAADEGDDGGESESGPLYQPVVDVRNQLTYIDICISEGKRGGGGKGGSGGKP
jgi:hypothetical protein